MESQLRQLYTRAFDQLKLRAEFLAFTPNASHLAVVEGQADIECARIAGLNQNIDAMSIIRLEVPVAHMAMQLWGRRAGQEVKSLELIFETQPVIGYVQGVKWAAAYLKAQKLENSVSVAGISLGMKMLAAGRLDYYLLPAVGVEQAFVEYPELNGEVHYITAVEEVALYPYIHRRHSALVPELTAVLRKLRSEPMLAQ